MQATGLNRQSAARSELRQERVKNVAWIEYVCGTDEDEDENEAVQDLWLAFGYSSGDVIAICHVMGLMGMMGNDGE